MFGILHDGKRSGFVNEHMENFHRNPTMERDIYLGKKRPKRNDGITLRRLLRNEGWLARLCHDHVHVLTCGEYKCACVRVRVCNACLVFVPWTVQMGVGGLVGKGDGHGKSAGR